MESDVLLKDYVSDFRELSSSISILTDQLQVLAHEHADMSEIDQVYNDISALKTKQQDVALCLAEYLVSKMD